MHDEREAEWAMSALVEHTKKNELTRRGPNRRLTFRRGANAAIWKTRCVTIGQRDTSQVGKSSTGAVHA